MEDSPEITVGEYDLPSLLDAQREFFVSGKTRPLKFRQEKLQRLEEILRDRTEDLLDALSKDLGKPSVEAYVAEVYFLLAELKLFRRKLHRWAKPKRAGQPFYFFPSINEVRLEPYGTSLVVAPWNYPAQLALGPAIGAIAAGNVVIIKPSEHAPATAQYLADIIGEVFDPEHVSVMQGGVETGKALLDANFDIWFYTGGEKVGRLYAEAAAKCLSPIVLELGGKCPCIIDDNADLDATVERIAATKFYNAGQTCIAPDFVAVPQNLKTPFIEKLLAALKEFYPESPSPDLARIVNESHFDRLNELVSDSAIQIGASDRSSLYFAPTILPDVTWDSAAMHEEIFGPVLPVLSYDDLGELLQEIGQKPTPLALYAFSRNRDMLESIATAVPSGSVCFNDAIKQATNLHLPFGGTGASGMGRYRGETSLQTFSYTRSYTRRWFLKDPFLLKPPYKNKLEQLRKFLK